MQLNPLNERFLDNLAITDSEFEVQLRIPHHTLSRSKKEKVTVRRRVEEILAEKERQQLICDPYAELI